MRKDLIGVERLIADLRQEGILENYIVEEHIIHIRTSQFLLLVYLPHSSRLEVEDIVKVIHLDIDLLDSSYSKVFKRLKGMMGKGKRVYARETVVARVDKRVTLEFLAENHINGPMAGKYRYGLFYKGELVSVAVFSGGRILRNISEHYRSFELIRFCHKADYLVTGGISKLVKAFIKDFKPNDIMTYADRDWSQQSSLETIGFREESVTSAQVFLVKDGVRLDFSDDKENFDYSIKNSGSIKLKLYL
jgi:hypothetical protein